MYVIYNRDTSELAYKYKSYKTGAAAKGALTKALNSGKLHPAIDWEVAAEEVYRANIEQQVEVTNLMTGEKFKESINIPSYLSPSSESFWSA